MKKIRSPAGEIQAPNPARSGRVPTWIRPPRGNCHPEIIDTQLASNKYATYLVEDSIAQRLALA